MVMRETGNGADEDRSSLSPADLAIYAGVGLGVWINGAIGFRLAGGSMFRSGPLVVAAVAVAIAISVCLVFRTTILWRGGPASEAVTIAAVMAWPGLMAEAGRMMFFHAMTGLQPENLGPFAAVIFLGNAALFGYALRWRLRSSA